jgi:hypothetical protein
MILIESEEVGDFNLEEYLTIEIIFRSIDKRYLDEYE